MNWMEIYQKYKVIIWPSIVGLAAIIIIILVIVPQFLTYFNLNNKITELQSHSQALEAKASELSQINEDSARQNLQAVFTILPTDPEVPTAMNLLQQYISTAGLELKNTTYLAGKGQGQQSGFQLDVVVSGPISSLRNFLISLENTPRLFQVQAINVQFQRGKNTVEADIPLSVFYQSLSQTIDLSSQQAPKLTQAEEQLLSKINNLIPQGNIVATSSASSSPININVPLGKADPFQ